MHVFCKGQLATMQANAPNQCNESISWNHDIDTFCRMIHKTEILEIGKCVVDGSQPLPDAKRPEPGPAALPSVFLTVEVPRHVHNNQQQENVRINPIEGRVQLYQDKKEHIHWMLSKAWISSWSEPSKTTAPPRLLKKRERPVLDVIVRRPSVIVEEPVVEEPVEEDPVVEEPDMLLIEDVPPPPPPPKKKQKQKPPEKVVLHPLAPAVAAKRQTYAKSTGRKKK